jgi:hypothetical protein
MVLVREITGAPTKTNGNETKAENTTMAASKKPAKSKGRVAFKDLKSKKNPKGGAFDTYMKIGGITGESSTSTIKVVTPTITTTDAFKVI